MKRRLVLPIDMVRSIIHADDQAKMEEVVSRLRQIAGLPLDEILSGQNLKEAFRDGRFCSYCPALALCPNWISSNAKLERAILDAEDEIIRMLLSRLLPADPDRPSIEEIAGDRTLAEAYLEGAYCPYCLGAADCPRRQERLPKTEASDVWEQLSEIDLS